MKQQLTDLIQQALFTLITDNVLPDIELPAVQIERTKDRAHGDFACNIALVLARNAKMNPRQLASHIVAAMVEVDFISTIEIAGPGFINITLSANASQQIVKVVLAAGDKFGCSQLGAGKSIHIEFVSANPTGPLHVGHGRGAAYGSVVSNLLTAVGFVVRREYYVNDAGRQMDILATSVWLRYLALSGESFTFPSNGYQGDYVLEIATTLKAELAEAMVYPAVTVFADICDDEPQGGDKEQHIDALITQAKTLLGEQRYQQLFDLALTTILAGIKADLSDFGCDYQQWFSERSLLETAQVDHVIALLKANDALYEKQGAWWFKASEFGDQKDRVVVRDNGQHTYFATDIAYHIDKFNRGFSQIMDVWGSDHHGYIPRVNAALTALGQDQTQLQVLLVQFAVLYRGKEKVPMSTRAGQFVTLQELISEVGKDAARFFYVMRGADQHMDFDLELAKSQSNDNPVYYVQYAHARICSVFRQLADRQLSWNQQQGEHYLSRLNEPQERLLLTMLARYPELLESAALNYTPHILAHYLIDLARDFHTYYNAHHFIIDDIELSQARLTLISAVKQVMANGLSLIGVSAPETM